MKTLNVWFVFTATGELRRIVMDALYGDWIQDVFRALPQLRDDEALDLRRDKNGPSSPFGIDPARYEFAPDKKSPVEGWADAYTITEL